MEYDIYINSTIGWPFSAEYVREELAKCKEKKCVVYLSSLGGSVRDALQIRQLFIEHGDVECHLHGFVASAATILAMGAKKVVMGEFALLLVHRCSDWVDTWGQMNAEEIERAIKDLESSKDALETIDRTIASIYAARTGKNVEEVAEWMERAEWLTAQECLDRGLVDEICKDDCQQTMTAALRGEFLACGLPLPKQEPREKKTARTLMQAISNIFDKKPTEIITNHTNNEPKMEQITKFALILAALSAENLMAADGKIEMTEEQVATLENHIASLNAEAAKKDERIQDLEQELATLKAQDGDDTTTTEGEVEDPAEDYAAAARASYDLLKGLE